MCAAVDRPLPGCTSFRSGTAWPAETPAEPNAVCRTAERFLVACLAARHDHGRLAGVRDCAPATEAGWQAVASLAREERLAPLLYHIVRANDLVPAAIENSWQGVYRESLRLSALWFHELETLADAFAGAGVPLILLKGAALGELVYGNPALRPMTDLDLLVRQADVPAALEILHRSGYSTSEPFGFFAEVEATKPGPPRRLVDLHWTLVAIPHYHETIPAEWVWEGARPAAVGAAAARVLGPEAQLLHLCAHLVLQHRDAGRHLLWFYDVAELLHHHKGDLDWPALFATASRFDMVLPLQEVLPRVAEDFGPPIPANALAALTALRASQQEIRIHRSFRAASWSASQIGWLSMATMPDWRSRLAYLRANLFPSGAYMRWRYRVRRPALLPVFYARRWLEGAGGVVGLLPILLRRSLIHSLFK